MKENQFIKTTYDGKVIAYRNFQKLSFLTRDGYICAQHVDDNKRMCCDPSNLDWYVIGNTTEPKECEACAKSFEIT